MSALTVVETDLDCEGGKEEIDVHSKSVSFPLDRQKKIIRKIFHRNRNRIIETESKPNRIESPPWNGSVLRSHATWMTTRRVRSTPTTTTPTTRAMDDKDISLNPSHAFHPSKSIRASAYTSGVSRANQIRRSAYLAFASSIIQTRRRRRRRRCDAMLTKTKQTNLFRSFDDDDVPEPWSP